MIIEVQGLRKSFGHRRGVAGRGLLRARRQGPGLARAEWCRQDHRGPDPDDTAGAERWPGDGVRVTMSLTRRRR